MAFHAAARVDRHRLLRLIAFMPNAHMLAIAALAGSIALVADAQTPAPRPAAPGTPTSPGTPARDRAANKGTAVVRGQLLDLAKGTPIRRARVSLAGGGPNSPSAQTDAEGRFEFRELPAGKYTFYTMKAGYLSLQATNNNKPVPPLTVGDGEIVEKIVLRLSRGGVVAGQILDEYGDPLAGAEVRVMRYRYIDGARQLTPAGSGGFPGASDDLGNFRVYGLEPGEYYIVARPMRDFMPIPGGAASGDGPAQTFYPGTASIAEARRVTVGLGRETQGIVFQLALARLSRIRGRVVTSSGEPFSGSVSLVSTEAMSGTQGFGGPVQPDGAFEVPNVAPGSYTLVARQNDFGNPSAIVEGGRARVIVNGEEINDVVIATSRGGTIRGRVTTDEGLPPPFAAGSLALYAQPFDRNAPPMGRGMAKVATDWSFEIFGLFDRVQLSPSGFAAGPNMSAGPWGIKAVLRNGEDVTDTGIEVAPGQVADNVEIVYSRKMSRLSGRLIDERGARAEGWVLLFSSQESLWQPRSRFVRASRPGPDGEYRFAGAAPHADYLLVAVDGIEDGQWQDPEFLRSIKDLATRISVGENETKTQDVKLVNWRR